MMSKHITSVVQIPKTAFSPNLYLLCLILYKSCLKTVFSLDFFSIVCYNGSSLERLWEQSRQRSIYNRIIPDTIPCNLAWLYLF